MMSSKCPTRPSIANAWVTPGPSINTSGKCCRKRRRRTWSFTKQTTSKSVPRSRSPSADDPVSTSAHTRFACAKCDNPAAPGLTKDIFGIMSQTKITTTRLQTYRAHCAPIATEPAPALPSPCSGGRPLREFAAATATARTAPGWQTQPRRPGPCGWMHSWARAAGRTAACRTC